MIIFGVFGLMLIGFGIGILVYPALELWARR